jgi:hypothetical protein
VDCGVNLRALFPEGLKVGMHALGHEFVDLAETELCPQSAGDARRQLGATLRQIPDQVQCRIHAIDRKSNRVRKLRVQQKKFGYAQRTNFRRMRLAVRLQRDAAPKQSHSRYSAPCLPEQRTRHRTIARGPYRVRRRPFADAPVLLDTHPELDVSSLHDSIGAK